MYDADMDIHTVNVTDHDDNIIIGVSGTRYIAMLIDKLKDVHIVPRHVAGHHNPDQ